MNLKMAFGQAGTFNVPLHASEDNVAPALLIAHIWNMDIWATKAGRAMELYHRDRVRNNEKHIGGRCLTTTYNELSYLRRDLWYLKTKPAEIMKRDEKIMDAVYSACQKFVEMQSFLQPILWTDLPLSNVDFYSDAEILKIA